MIDSIPKSFEEAIPVINQELIKRKHKWTLQAINEMDYDDVSQIIRIHIFKKFSKYDKKQPFSHWLNKIISNQIKNLLRNKYYAFERPCLSCASNQDDGLCSITSSGKQCSECPLYAQWHKRKKPAHDVKLAVSIENHAQEVSEKPCDYVDLEKNMVKLSERLRECLRPIEWRVYKLLYIDNKSENQVAHIMNYTTSEAGKSPGYKRLAILKKTIIRASKEILKEGLD